MRATESESVWHEVVVRRFHEGGYLPYGLHRMHWNIFPVDVRNMCTELPHYIAHLRARASIAIPLEKPVAEMHVHVEPRANTLTLNTERVSKNNKHDNDTVVCRTIGL